MRIELGDVPAAELREGLRRDLKRFVREEARSPLGLLPRRFEVRFGTDRSAPELQRGLELGDGIFVSGTIDRIDVDPHSARGIVQDYKSGKGSFSASQILDEGRLQVPLYLLVLRDLVGIEPLGGVYRALSGTRGARGMLRDDARDDLPGFQRRDYLDDEAFAAQLDAAVERARTAAQRIRAGDVVHDPKGGDCPSWCDVWRMCRVARGMNEQQLAAVEARGEVFVSAGAGTGKTTVLVERFVRAVCDEGLDVESVLVITYTRKAAAELRGRIRAALLERGRDDLAQRLDGAWISTIHGFCARLLRAHPFAVGIDPRFHELDEQHGAVIRGEAFDAALEEFCGTRLARPAAAARRPTAPSGCAGCSPASTRRCARRAGRSCSCPGRRPTSTGGLPSCARRRSASRATWRRRRASARSRSRRSTCPPIPTGCST